jgi:hypothetical protein
MHPLGNFCDPYCQKEAFPDMGVLTKCDQIEPIYLPQSVATYISLHPVYSIDKRKSQTVQYASTAWHSTTGGDYVMMSSAGHFTLKG